LRELKEETGYGSDNIERLASYYKDPGFSAVQMHVYLVRDAEKRGEPTDLSELVTVELLTPEEILKAVDDGSISCSLCISAALKTARKLGW
jgi:8-oxo-dGTP pyrophosphatase MutT (NUDIX family)